MERKEKIKKALELYNLIELYYNDLDSLTRRLQDDFNIGVPFEQEEQDRLALSMILDFTDTIRTNITTAEREITKKVDTNIEHLEIEEQIKIIRKDTQDYGETQILSYIEPMRKCDYELYALYYNVLLFPELYTEYADIFPNKNF